jgi:mannose-6-phosphate isomerase
VPHAYLEGQNVEIMADSDNVLRGGLTNKHVDVKELMKHIQFEETVPVTLHPQKNNNNEEVYMTAVPDFRLTHFKLKEEDVSSFKSATGEILLLIEGKVLILSDSDELELSKGEAAFIPVDSHITIKALAGGDLFRATVPVHTGE